MSHVRLTCRGPCGRNLSPHPPADDDILLSVICVECQAALRDQTADDEPPQRRHGDRRKLSRLVPQRLRSERRRGKDRRA